MIARIKGFLVYKSPQYQVIDVCGVGYRIFTPFLTFCGLPVENSEVVLHIHTSVREDAITLYGFISIKERDLFSILLNVSGIGPKIALAVLSKFQADDVINIIKNEDAAMLSSVPGIGGKTAARLFLDLQGKLDGFLINPIYETMSSNALIPDIISVLTNLGYDRKIARKAAETVSPELSLEDAIKEALKLMTPGKR